MKKRRLRDDAEKFLGAYSRFRGKAVVRDAFLLRARKMFGSSWPTLIESQNEKTDEVIVASDGGKYLEINADDCIYCLYASKLHNPGEGICATYDYDCKAKTFSSCNYSRGKMIDPPTGYPANVVCSANGEIISGVYAKEPGVVVGAGEIRRRVASLMCCGKLDIVAVFQTGQPQS